MFYAICLPDLTAIMQSPDALPVLLLLTPLIDQGQLVECEKRAIDGVGVLLNGRSERTGATVRVLRKRLAKNQLRVWQSKTGRKGWKRI